MKQTCIHQEGSLMIWAITSKRVEIESFICFPSPLASSMRWSMLPSTELRQMSNVAKQSYCGWTKKLKAILDMPCLIRHLICLQALKPLPDYSNLNLRKAWQAEKLPWKFFSKLGHHLIVSFRTYRKNSEKDKLKKWMMHSHSCNWNFLVFRISPTGCCPHFNT